MAPFRGRKAPRGSGKLARSGIRTRAGYRKFDSQRVKEVEPVDSNDGHSVQGTDDDPAANGQLSDEDDSEELQSPAVKPYNTLLSTFSRPSAADGSRRKRRKLEERVEVEHKSDTESDHDLNLVLKQDSSGDEVEEQSQSGELDKDDDGHHDAAKDPYEIHFANPDENELSRRLKAVQNDQWKTEKRKVDGVGQLVIAVPDVADGISVRLPSVDTINEFPLKPRLISAAVDRIGSLSALQTAIAPPIIHYNDLMLTTRNPENAKGLRNIACLHALNHVFKGRDRIIKNSARLAHSEDQEIEARDQGFTRPKVLVLLETRQMCVKYADTIVDFFAPEQQENRQRFDSSFASPVDDRDHLPNDFRELFEGNNDNNFMTALKFTRKTLKFYAPFYTSDIILASPLGLRRVLEKEDPKKRDYDFLSSIEVVIADQAEAMQMQNWENVESVFQHLNLQLREAHGCDFNRVRSWYLDGHAKYLRQTIVFGAYLTPEMNKLFNSNMQNVAGKAKLISTNAEGTILSASGLSLKQTFSRFDCPSPEGDPDARFKYFTSTVLPAALRLPKPADGAQGLLIFIPSYYDFLRIRNFFATSTLTENLSFGTIHDYSEVSAQRRARAHFVSGKHSILLYTQRAHHFYRLRLKGVKRVIMYGLPDNPLFYEELIAGFLGTTIEEGRASPEEASVRAMFSKWDGLRLERVVGRERVRGMLSGKGDTFDFV